MYQVFANPDPVYGYDEQLQQIYKHYIRDNQRNLPAQLEVCSKGDLKMMGS